MDIEIRTLTSETAVEGIEIVERKGIGHPDTICDGVAGQVSIELSRYYLRHFGAILHHNVDKVLLCAGTVQRLHGRDGVNGGQCAFVVKENVTCAFQFGF